MITHQSILAVAWMAAYSRDRRNFTLVVDWFCPDTQQIELVRYPGDEYMESLKEICQMGLSKAAWKHMACKQVAGCMLMYTYLTLSHFITLI